MATITTYQLDTDPGCQIVLTKTREVAYALAAGDWEYVQKMPVDIIWHMLTCPTCSEEKVGWTRFFLPDLGEDIAVTTPHHGAMILGDPLPNRWCALQRIANRLIVEGRGKFFPIEIVAVEDAELGCLELAPEATSLLAIMQVAESRQYMRNLLLGQAVMAHYSNCAYCQIQVSIAVILYSQRFPFMSFSEDIRRAL